MSKEDFSMYSFIAILFIALFYTAIYNFVEGNIGIGFIFLIPSLIIIGVVIYSRVKE